MLLSGDPIASKSIIQADRGFVNKVMDIFAYFYTYSRYANE